MNKRKPRCNYNNYENYSELIQKQMDLEVIELYFKHKRGKYTKKDSRRFLAITCGAYHNPTWYFETLLEETAKRIENVRLGLIEDIQKLSKSSPTAA